VVFLYLIMPWLMRVLSKLSRGQQIGLLVASPLISLAPTLVFLQVFPDGAKDSQNWQIFLGSTPESKSLSFWFAVIGLLVMAVISTHLIEKPLARKLRKRNLTTREIPAGSHRLPLRRNIGILTGRQTTRAEQFGAGPRSLPGCRHGPCFRA